MKEKLIRQTSRKLMNIQEKKIQCKQTEKLENQTCR